MSLDLLQLLHTATISYEEAEAIFDNAVGRFHAGEIETPWPEELGLSEHEATAYLHEATLADLVRLRYDGWPTKCCKCGQEIDYRNYSWWLTHAEGGDICLQHIKCP